jgi:Gas vesicle protein
MPRMPASRPRARTKAELVLADEGSTLLDVVDNVLTKGVVLTGDLVIALANVDLVYARLSLLLCAADSVTDALERRQNRRVTRTVPKGPRGRG